MKYQIDKGRLPGADTDSSRKGKTMQGNHDADWLLSQLPRYSLNREDNEILVQEMDNVQHF